jgi:lipoprotein-releasing system ATP-binding protein
MSALLFNFHAAKKAYMIQAINIQKFYGDLKVLKGVDLHIKKGEIVSIVGPSGAGKTTLLQILGTLDVQSNKVDSKLLINDIEVSDLSERELAKFRNQHIGFIFQFHQLLPEFTALENVCIPAYIKKTPKAEVEKRAKELLEFLGLSHRIHHKPNELSGGEQQRVAVARSLINNPSIIFADEPSGNLDSESADTLHKLFFELRDKFGQTFVIVTHNLELADLADRKLTMVDGRITDSVGIEWTDFTNRPLL